MRLLFLIPFLFGFTFELEPVEPNPEPVECPEIEIRHGGNGNPQWVEYTISPKPEKVMLEYGAGSQIDLEFFDFGKWASGGINLSDKEKVKLIIDGYETESFDVRSGSIKLKCSPLVEIKPNPGEFNYGHALQLGYLFFAANQLGNLTDKRLPWRQDTATDGQFSSGYVDAGDNIFFGKAGYAACATMGIVAHYFEEELKSANQWEHHLNVIRHYVNQIKLGYTATNGEFQSLIVQMGNSPIDHKKWYTIEEIDYDRPIYRIDKNRKGSDYAGLAAACLGSAYKVLNDESLLEPARKIQNFGLQYRGLGHENGHIVTVYKNANRDEDELALGYIGLWLATGESEYLAKADNILDDTYLSAWAGGYEHQEQMVSTILALNGYTNRDSRVKNYLNMWKNATGEIRKTEGGYHFHQTGWGTAGSVMPALTYASIYSKHKPTKEYDSFIKNQVDYNLGKNPANNVYLCGYYTRDNCSKVHHRGASGGKSHGGGNKENQHMLWGAVLGGITANDFDFVNSHSDWRGNEPTVTYNTNWVSPTAYLYSLYGGSPLSENALSILIRSK